MDNARIGYMIDVGIESKERGLTLSPINNPKNWNRGIFPAMTREIFDAAVSRLISIWVWIWVQASD